MNPADLDVAAGDRLSIAGRLLRISKNLLTAGNYSGSKKLVLEALDSDPLVDGADQILAVAEVLLASKRLINNNVNSYAVLQLDTTADLRAIRHQYRRLALLLRSPLPGSDEAARLVDGAWAVLSDPSRKSLLDAELAGGGARERPAATFWTSCPSCFYVHEYNREYEGRCMYCQNCRRSFDAVALAAPPPIVPGTEMYYCSWSCYPLGFTNGVEGGYTPFHPRSPTNAANCGVTSPPTVESEETAPQPERPARKRKVVAKKPAGKVRVAERKAGIELPVTVGADGCDGIAAVASAAHENVTPMVIDLNEDDDARASVKKDEGVVVVDHDDDDTESFELVLDDADMDASCDLLDNLSNMPPVLLV